MRYRLREWVRGFFSEGMEVGEVRSHCSRVCLSLSPEMGIFSKLGKRVRFVVLVLDIEDGCVK